MTEKKRIALTPELARKWSDLGHMLFIEALTSSSVLRTNQFAFHGGTSLHLSWKSPRFSEDLDFLLDRTLGERMTRLMRKVEKRLQALVFAVDPLLQVSIQDRTGEGENLLNYRITLSSPAVHGHVKVKAEFWQVDPDYLDRYETRFAYPVKEGDLISKVTQPLPAATLESAYADKMTALATRRHLKWRDLFDIWWIGRQTEIDPKTMASRFLHHVTAFQTVENLPPREALLKFLEHDPQKIAEEADPDLKKWLPPVLWSHLKGSGVNEIVAEVRDAIRRIADAIPEVTPEVHGEMQDERTDPQP